MARLRGREQRRSLTGRIFKSSRISRGVLVRHQPDGWPLLPKIGSANGDPARGTSGGKIRLPPSQSPVRATRLESVASVVCSAICLETDSAAEDYIGYTAARCQAPQGEPRMHSADCNSDS